jgi:sulfide:quinone oxidoreductase
MPKKLLVLGGGTGGLAISKEVRELFKPEEVEITVVDMRDRTEFPPRIYTWRLATESRSR